MAASYEEIIEAIAGVLRSVDGIGKVADIDEEVGPRWEKQPKLPEPAYWLIFLASETQDGKSGAGTAVMERPVFRIDGVMPIWRRAKTGRIWLRLVKAVMDALRADRTLGGVVGTCSLPSIVQMDDETARGAVEGRGEFQCHHVVIEITVSQFVAQT